jgi:BMFP domain-containing protein YqiC
MKNEPERVKPDDCTCAFPRLIARNITLHAPDCPAYKRIMARFKDNRKPELTSDVKDNMRSRIQRAVAEIKFQERYPVAEQSDTAWQRRYKQDVGLLLARVEELEAKD